ncbi:MAG: tRNA lysidine(34) synthetase TilS [Candidatus Omnitrophica bacterium]|nr:tRNA lysidine(34) synthetase TilS [Candidatus Omnitrophota bacterium]
MLDKVRQTIARYNMLKKGDRVLVGVSGGPDSTALLNVLHSIKKEFRATLIVAHLNHMIRKGAAEKDAIFVKKMVEELGLEAVVESEDVPKLAREGKLSLEEAARNARYDFYSKAARRYGANKIALGHTRDDQAETVAMRLIRGAGLLGLSGMPPVRRFGDTIIIRPLIDASKDEILKYLTWKRIPYRRDLTNTKQVYFRNKVRLKLLPFIERNFSPKIRELLAATAENLLTDYNFLSGVAEKKFRRYSSRVNGAIKLDLKFLDEDPAVQRMVIREAVRTVKGDLNAVTYGHWKDLKGLLGRTSKKGWSFCLPSGVWVRRAQDGLIFFRKSGQREKSDYKKKVYRLEAPGRTRIPEAGKTIYADLVKRPVDFKLKKTKMEEYFDYDKLRFPLVARFRKTRDRMRPLGMKSYKRIKQIFVNEKVPREKRGEAPLVVSGKKIVWICGVKRADEARITDATKRILRLKYG